MTDLRTQISDAQRIVIKVGSSSLTKPEGGIDPQAISALVAEIAARKARGHQVVLVSSGAIATGFPLLGQRTRPRDLATQQAAASVGQGLLLAHYTQAFAEHGITVGQVLLTADDVTRRTHYRNAQRTLFRLLDLGVVPIVNENDTVATDEIRLGDNDRLAALVAHVVQAEALILLSDVDGLYDGPPDRAGAQPIVEVTGPSDLEGVDIGGVGLAGVGLGGMTSKVTAARIATSAGIPTLVSATARAREVLATASIGTVFHPTGTRAATRLLWLAHATTPTGTISVDAGAVTALRDRRVSLLPAGIIAVDGAFLAGEPVDVVGPTGERVARGLVNYDAVEIPSLMGRSTRDLAQERGREYEREVIHRDDMVLLTDLP